MAMRHARTTALIVLLLVAGASLTKELSRVEETNLRFYEAFTERDIDKMAQVWSKSPHAHVSKKESIANGSRGARSAPSVGGQCSATPAAEALSSSTGGMKCARARIRSSMSAREPRKNTSRTPSRSC